MGLNYGSYGGISNSFSTGAVTGTTTVGGLVGRNYGSSDSINSSFSTGAVTGTTNVGGLVGVNDGNFGNSIRNSYYDIGSVSINGTNGLITLGGISDNQYQTWVAGKYASLNPASYFTQNSSGFYQLSTAQDLLNLLPFTEDNFSTTRFQLTANIDLTNQPGWFIPYFGAKQFDGNGFTISNLSVNQPYNDNIGFIGILVGGGNISNLGLRGGSVSGSSTVGELVGYNGYGSSVSNSYSTGTVTGATTVGYGTWPGAYIFPEAPPGTGTFSLGARSWTETANSLRLKVGDKRPVNCSGNGTIASVWGTGTYTADSSICTAAVHAGLIDQTKGGEVTIEVIAGTDTYEGSTAHGVTTSSYGAYDPAYRFVS